MDLQPGQNVSITQHSPPPAAVEITLAWEPVTTPLAIDSSAFALSAQGKVRGDGDFIFYNQLALAGGGLQRASDGRSFTIAFAQLPAGIERIVMALTIDQGQRRGQSFGQLSQVRAEIRDAGSKATLAAFPLATRMMPETALIVGELYRRNNEWKFRAVGQGFVGGLGPLARQYGVDVADDPDVAEAAPPPRPTAPTPASAPPPSPKGFFGRLTSRKVDLDLGCLFKLSDGRPGAVQALGGSFGSLQQPPYIQLMGDDRSGASAAGEFLHINGQQWNQLDRVLLFAMIYEGVPNWAETDAVVTIRIPGQPTLELRVDSHRNDQRMCALAMLENQSGNIKVTKLVEYFADHRVLDQAYGFGLRWVAGSKD